MRTIGSRALAGLAFGVLISFHTSVVSGQWQKGRDLEDRKTWTVGITAGSIFDLDGEVQETERPLFEFTDDHSGAPPEDYSWDELGFDDNYFVLGIYAEKMWRYVTVHANAFYGNPSVSGTADRHYFIGVEKVTFEGEDYEHMMIPEGQEYRGDIRAGKLELRTMITPVSYRTRRNIEFTPWIHISLFGFLGDYEIDAGPAQGVRQYERPPRDYVIGGKGTGTTGIIVPEFGLGGEVRFPTGASSHISLQAFYALLKVSGRTGDFGVTSRREKALDVDYHTFGVRGEFEYEVSDRLGLVAGVEFTHRTGDAEVRAKSRPEDEILELREKFDKDVSFQLSTLIGFLGLRF